MPGFDGTGPLGLGPRTGGGFGFCPPGPPRFGWWGAYPVFGVGRGGIPWGGGRGRAFGGGRGWWWRRGRWFRFAHPWWGFPAYYPPYSSAYIEPTPEEEKTYLEEEVNALEEELNLLRERLTELEKEKAEKKK